MTESEIEVKFIILEYFYSKYFSFKNANPTNDFFMKDNNYIENTPILAYLISHGIDDSRMQKALETLLKDKLAQDSYRITGRTYRISPLGVTEYERLRELNQRPFLQPRKKSNQRYFDEANAAVDRYNSRKLFISHSSKDKEIVNEFVEGLLIIGLGIDKSKIFYTSIDELGISTGENFKSRIENELENAKAVIQILTENYKKSEVCMNEMGAAWALSKEILPLVLNLKSNEVGFINITTQYKRLDSKEHLKTFIYELKQKGLIDKDYHDGTVERRINELLQKITSQSVTVPGKGQNDKSPKKDLDERSALEKRARNLQDKIASEIHMEMTFDAYKHLIVNKNPFWKINNQSNNGYILIDRKFCLIPDAYTAGIIGFKKFGDFNKITIKQEDLKALVGKPLKSVMDSQIWQVWDGTMTGNWVIYNKTRHLCNNQNILSKFTDGSRINVSEKKLKMLPQGDDFWM